ncbi:TetR/AcrR family transcriptional regulator [Demequina zhanjiangensis]|uniref:TetR/AcrR family transcriptional regulator n=1 Tax=Demequina zhanjiangensis TaxID=3051659 RepID=A0ABT8G0H2_9MICO|nr:TetR/AcrR family transcriptional regulator [Demequina sp. SYSU T00b26]MDN4472633.1 TetR/AcrR family transcriptional regulator [Demequina sp. SYSU T00b26]
MNTTATESTSPTPKSAHTRQRILDAAAEVLSRKGYAGTRLADVAAVARVQAPAIYYYFSSRDELVEEVMWVGANRVRLHLEEVLAALPAHTSQMDRLMVAVDAHLRFELQLSHYATASIRNAGHVPEQIRIRPAAEEALYSRLWRDLFVAAQQAGEVRPDLDINVFRLLLLGALNWVVEWWNPRTRSLDELVATAQSMVRNGAGVR